MALDITFEWRESEMRGGDYYLYRSETEEIVLQSNRDGRDFAEEEFPDITALLYVSDELRMGQVQRLMAEARLLRTEF